MRTFVPVTLLLAACSAAPVVGKEPSPPRFRAMPSARAAEAPPDPGAAAPRESAPRSEPTALVTRDTMHVGMPEPVAPPLPPAEPAAEEPSVEATRASPHVVYGVAPYWTPYYYRRHWYPDAHAAIGLGVGLHMAHTLHHHWHRALLRGSSHFVRGLARVFR